MLTKDFAQRFTTEWLDAWNAHDLERVLSHYDDEFEMSSPFIATLAGESSGRLRGKAAIAKYWKTALERIPNLHFELTEILVGADTLVIHYRGHRGPVAEVFKFAPSGKVTSAAAHYL